MFMKMLCSSSSISFLILTCLFSVCEYCIYFSCLNIVKNATGGNRSHDEGIRDHIVRTRGHSCARWIHSAVLARPLHPIFGVPEQSALHQPPYRSWDSRARAGMHPGGFSFMEFFVCCAENADEAVELSDSDNQETPPSSPDVNSFWFTHILLCALMSDRYSYLNSKYKIFTCYDIIFWLTITNRKLNTSWK